MKFLKLEKEFFSHFNLCVQRMALNSSLRHRGTRFVRQKLGDYHMCMYNISALSDAVILNIRVQRSADRLFLGCLASERGGESRNLEKAF